MFTDVCGPDRRLLRIQRSGYSRFRYRSSLLTTKPDGILRCGGCLRHLSYPSRRNCIYSNFK